MLSPAVSLPTLVAYPFRIFFLSLALWAAAVVALWVPIISGQLHWPLAWPALMWHQHEMLFGVLNAAIAGFLLTAVCVWTNTERLHGSALLALWLVWLAGRLLATFGQAVPEGIVAGVNLLFLPLVMLDAGRRILAARQHRHLIVLAVLTLIWVMQAGFLLGAPATFAEAALLATTLLMMVIGGRITPAFSRNWLQRHGRDPAAVRTVVPLERLVIASLLLVVLAVATRLPAQVVASLAVLAAVFAGTRLLLWRGWLVRAEPLLWILHLSLWWIPVALLLLAGARLGWWPASAWLHAAGAGAMGGLILGVIARVSLGHTGRPLILPSGMTLAFVLLHVGAVVRVLTAFTALPWKAGIIVSGSCWVIAFALFVWRYTPILASPRVDGKAG